MGASIITLICSITAVGVDIVRSIYSIQGSRRVVEWVWGDWQARLLRFAGRANKQINFG